MKTADTAKRFLDKCHERGLSSETIRKYRSYLGRFYLVYKEVPTDQETIEKYLKSLKETPAHRGVNYKALQAFYSYLEEYEDIKSPVPAKGKIGRPQKFPSLVKTTRGPGLGTVPGPGGQISSLAGEKVGDVGIITAEAVDSFTRSRQLQGVSQNTLSSYRTIFKPFIRKFTTLPLKTEDLEEFFGSLAMAPESRWTYRRTILALYHYLEERGRLPKDLVTFPKIKVPRKVRRVLSEEELHQLFSSTQNFQESAILSLLIDTKIRASELCNLDREDVHPDHIKVTGKTGERQVPIASSTYDLLVQLSPSGLVFRTEGRPMSRRMLYNIINRICHRANLDGKKLGPHILRHSASVQHIVGGGDLSSLQEELGHTTPKMTAHYAKLAFPQVSTVHQKVGLVDKFANHKKLERAICHGCQNEVVTDPAWLKTLKCAKCGQVGNWYTPDYHPAGVERGEPLPVQEALLEEGNV